MRADGETWGRLARWIVVNAAAYVVVVGQRRHSVIATLVSALVVWLLAIATRWRWWFAANLTTCLLGAAAAPGQQP